MYAPQIVSYTQSPATKECYTCHFWFIVNDEAFFRGEEEITVKNDWYNNFLGHEQ